MTYIPDDFISGRVEHVVERDGQLYHPEIGCKVSSFARYLFNNNISKLLCQQREFFPGEFFKINRRFYILYQHVQLPPQGRPCSVSPLKNIEGDFL